MSWEVPSMKSKTSFFDPGVCRNLLRRCWPLWTAWFVLLLFLLPVSLTRLSAFVSPGSQDMNRAVLNAAEYMIPLSFGMAILTAMCMFSYLYNTRSCGLMNSLPIRRETAFGTAYLTGLLPMLLAELLVFALTAAFYGGRGVTMMNLLRWLLAAVLSSLAFYGVAVFCAMLTGSLFILPLVYAVLSFAAWVAESCLHEILGALIYGFPSAGKVWLSWLSPPVALMNRVNVSVRSDDSGWQLFGLGALAVYAGVGLVLSFLALLLYKKRQMEYAGDTVAFPILKPLFRYCMAFGTAVVFASMVYSLLLGGSFHGRTAALVLLALLLLGAALGWYAAEMLIRRTVRVFPGKWKGLVLVCAALCVLSLGAELDLTGFEGRVPEPEQVESLQIPHGKGITLRQPENIREATELHRRLVEHKSLHEGEIHEAGVMINLHYILKDGRTVERSYYLACFEPEDPEDLVAWEKLLNCPEAQEQRAEGKLPVTEETFYAATFHCTWFDEEGRDQYAVVRLTAEQALDFYENAVLPDRAAHTLDRVWLYPDGAQLDLSSNVSFYLELRQQEGDQTHWDHMNLEICMDAEDCLRWIRENTDLPVMSRREAEMYAATEATDLPAAVREP